MWVYFKSGEKACTGLNLKAISEGTGKVVKRVGVWGNLKAKSGGMGKDFRKINDRIPIVNSTQNRNPLINFAK